MIASSNAPSLLLESLKQRMEGRWIKLGARKRGIVILVERNCVDVPSISVNKKGKKIKKENVSQATFIAWVIEDLSKEWMMEPGSTMDKDFVVAYEANTILDENILELYARADDREVKVGEALYC